MSSNVYLVDDDVSVRRSLDRLFRVAGHTVETFSSPSEFLRRLPIHGEGCIVTDLRMPEMSGLELQQAIRREGCKLPILFISGHGEVPDAVQAMKGGAVDYLQKPLDPQKMLDSVQSAMIEGQRIVQADRCREQARLLVATLTPRERQVCELVCRGLLNKQIAAELGTSEKTVKAQRGKATRKLKVNSTAALVDLLRRAA